MMWKLIGQHARQHLSPMLQKKTKQGFEVPNTYQKVSSGSLDPRIYGNAGHKKSQQPQPFSRLCGRSAALKAAAASKGSGKGGVSGSGFKSRQKLSEHKACFLLVRRVIERWIHQGSKLKARGFWDASEWQSKTTKTRLTSDLDTCPSKLSSLHCMWRMSVTIACNWQEYEGRCAFVHAKDTDPS